MSRVIVTLPASLKRAAEEFAEKDGVSLNQYIAKVGARGAAEAFAERGKGADAERVIRFLEGAGGGGRWLNLPASVHPPYPICYSLPNFRELFTA